MGTHSTISVKLLTEQIHSVYCHYDGIINSNGKMLLNHYNSQKLAEKLISLGPISYIAPSFEPPIRSIHTFKSPNHNVTLIYSRDRNESCRYPNNFNSEKEFLLESKIEEYNYFFKENEWFVTMCKDRRKWIFDKNIWIKLSTIC